MLFEAMDRNARALQRRIDRPHGREDHWLMPPRLQRQRGIERDLGLPAIHMSPIENEDDTHVDPWRIATLTGRRPRYFCTITSA